MLNDVKVHPIYFPFSCLPVFHVFWSPNFSHPGLFSEPRYFTAFHHTGDSADFLLQFICSSDFAPLCQFSYSRVISFFLSRSTINIVIATSLCLLHFPVVLL